LEQPSAQVNLYTFSGVHSGESFRIEGIAKDATYEVTGFGVPGGFTQSAVEGNEGTIGAGQTSRASFTNAYEATGSVTLAAKKTLEGGDLANYTFTFQLFDQTNKPLQIKTTDAAGNVTFDALGFSAADAGTRDAPKKYTYKIAEVNDAQQNVVYDAHSGWLDVNVWDDGAGTITAQAVYDHEGGKPSTTSETFKNKLLHPVELPATGGPGWAVPVAIVIIVATGTAARRMRRRLH
jgi:pilin isopeptide linkage protein